METFWQTISEYNSHTWPVQAAAAVMAAAAVTALRRRPTAATRRCMRLLLAAMSIWTAVAYYFIYCSPRAYNTALGIFWLIMGGIWLFGAVRKGGSGLTPVRKHRVIAPIIMAAPLAYPLISLARGMTFPQIVTPLMPCGLAVFTVGVMLAFAPRPNIFILMMMFHWAMIGIFKIRHFSMPEEIVTVAAIVTGIFLILRDYIAVRYNARLKPRPRVIAGIASAICILVIILLVYVLAGC